MTCERTFDYSLVRMIVTAPEVYRNVTEDGAPPPEQYKAIESDSVYYLVIKDDALLGMFAFVPTSVSGVCYEVHTCLLRAAWGEKANEAAKLAEQWMWDNTGAQRIITSVPEYNALARRFAERQGMRQYGLNPRAYLKGGQLMDIYLLGISRPCQ